MGWDFTYGASKQDIIEDRCKSWECTYDGTESYVPPEGPGEYGAKFLKKHVAGRECWAMFEYRKPGVEPRNIIALFLLDRAPNVGWGSKHMDESVHPYYYRVPVSWLDEAPEANAEWRAEVRRRAAA